jgi:hypothetical protein
MRLALPGFLQQARRQIRSDLRADPYLRYILLAATLLTAFWVWHRAPNFATRDERWRIVDPTQPVGLFLEDPSVESLRRGITQWRSYGATFYLYGLVLVPVYVGAILLGEGQALTTAADHLPVSYWEHWRRTPAWFWTSSILLTRLTNVALAVGSVYVTYRIGATARDRATGRLSALLFTFTWGFLVLAHEAGEDVPSVFFFLLATYFALRYVETGSARTFYRGCLAGGVAAAMKLSGGMAAVLIGVAFLQRAVREADDEGWRGALVRPRLLGIGFVLGTGAILAGYPSVLIGVPQEFGGRVTRAVGSKSTPHGWLVRPGWWWITRSYLNGAGLPLAVGYLGGLLAALPAVRRRTPEAVTRTLALVGVVGFLAVMGGWAYVRVHHLLPTFPLLAVLLALALGDVRERLPRLGRAVVAVLLVTSAIYAGVGVLGYAAQPRDQATQWLADRGENATVETYVGDPQEAGVPHGMSTNHVGNRTMAIGGVRQTPSVPEWTLEMPRRCPEYIQLTYHRSLLFLAPDDHSKRSRVLWRSELTDYYESLLRGNEYPYEVAETFGRRPPFLDGERRDSPWSLLRVGLRPRTIQYGDPQDMGVNQYTIVLERTGTCDPELGSSGSRDRPSIGG